MSSFNEQKSSTVNARIAHVLFIDIVGYSLAGLSEQARMLERLNAAISETAAFAQARAASQLQLIPSGDGMALLFFEDVTAPSRCAIEASRALSAGKSTGTPTLDVRMGIHSGLVQQQMDIAGNENVVGEGINTAQRVMNVGEAGHILLSAQYAGWLREFEQWSSLVMPLGEAVVKHGQRVPLFTMCGPDFGRGDIPSAMASGSPPPAPSLRQEARETRVGLLYRRNSQPDDTIIEFIEAQLRNEGFDVFVDRHTRIGIDWAREVERNIREADAVIAIVSPRALQSEMLEFELETAADQSSRSGGKPMILPVSIGLENGIDGPIAAIISPLRQFRWDTPNDDHQLAIELVSAIRDPLRPRSAEVRLEPVGGAVSPDSSFYVERACDVELAQSIAERESIVLLKGPRQVGKTSLQARGAKLARGRDWRVVITDFQKVSQSQMTSDDAFYRLMAATLARQLKFTYDFACEWDEYLGANLNLENFLCALLDASEQPLVWCMDEVDKLFTAPFAADFFGLVRSWHNARSTEPGAGWDKLMVVIAYATEAHLFIQDLNQSPFNVGRRLDLDDFNLQQIVDLNRRYGDPLRRYADAEALHSLIGGQPYLTRACLDAVATGKLDFASLMAQADRDDGPLNEHLKRILVSVSYLPAIVTFVRAVLAGTASALSDLESYYRLMAAGVIRQGPDGRLSFRCELYRRYLAAHLA